MKIDEKSLATVVDDVNHAHFFGHSPTKKDARAATAWIRSRFWQDIPAKIRAAKNPDPRWAAIPKTFVLTDQDQKSKLRAFTGEPVQNASMRMIYSREAARALLVLSEVTGQRVPEAEEHCASVFSKQDLADREPKLYCCGPCTASVWRLMNTGVLGGCEDKLDSMLGLLPLHRDDKGTWHRFPFFFTLLALIEMDRPAALAELKYAQPECEKKRKRLKPKDTYAERKLEVLDRVLQA